MGIELNSEAGQSLVREVIKASYESNDDTNVFTDAEKSRLSNQSGSNTGDQDLTPYQTKPTEGAFEDGDKTKLDNIEVGATADQTDAEIIEAVAPVTNPKALSQAIHMTEATSGSNGIKVLNNDDINFGTGDFTIPVGLILPNYTPTANVTLYHKHDGTNGVIVLLLTTGIIRVTINAANYDSTVAVSASNNIAITLIISVARETASVAGEVLFFENNNQLGAAVAIIAGTPTTVDNTSALYVIGTSATRTAATLFFCHPYNRALNADDEAYLYKNGIHPSDMWGSQTPVYESNFSAGVDGFSSEAGSLTGNIDSIAGEDDCLRFTVDATLANHAITKSGRFIAGVKYKVYFRYYVPSGQSEVNGIYLNPSYWGGVADSSNNVLDVWSEVVHEFIATSSYFTVNAAHNQGTYFQDTGADNVIYIRDIAITIVGAIAAYLPENIQPVPGQWLDAANGNHALMPAEGCTLIRPENDFEIRWTNTWAGTSEMQYIGGTNQAILPEGNIRIEYITLTCTATGVDITIGDGSDADYFVTATALADYLDISSPTKRNHDGTNRDMTITPSGAFTGSITTTVVGKILD